MHNLVFDRIQSQISRRVQSSVQAAFEAIKEVTVSPPISLEELREMLMVELGEPVIAVQCQTIPSLHFESIYDFVPWYEQNKSRFSDQQKTALDTLVKTRAMIDAGCACKRDKREIMAGQYFEQFWLNNGKTDLLSTIARVSGAEQVSVNKYCSYSSTQ